MTRYTGLDPEADTDGCCLRPLALKYLLGKPRHLFLVLIFFLSITLLYLFLLINSYTSSTALVRLLHVEPQGPRLMVYNSSIGVDRLVPLLTEYSKVSHNHNHTRKLILFWTPKYGDYSLHGWGINAATLAGCPVKCDFAVDHQLEESADAIVFHPAVDMALRNNLPTHRRPDQVYIMAWGESPHYTLLNLRGFSNYFNWTMTYRRTSEVYSPYGVFIPRPAPLDTIPEKYTRQKTGPGAVAWLVSSCDSISRREDMAKELGQYIPVHIYGACGDGTHTCPEDRSVNCMEWLAARYKFYLAFENSLCMDYVTEKFFNPLTLGMVPIYYGGHGLEHVAPPNSFINVLNYSSIAKLAAQLLFLDQNEDEYQKYFEWTKKYTVGYPKEWCQLCQKLQRDREREGDTNAHHTYTDLHGWWNERDERGNPICLENVSYVDRWNAFWDYVL